MLASSSQPANSTTILASSANDVSFVGATFASTNGATTVAVDAHVGGLVGDLLLVVVGHRAGSSGTITITTPSGWQALTQINSGTTLAQRTFYKIATSADLSTAHTFQLGANTKAAATMLVFRGISAVGSVIASSGQANSQNTSIAVPGLTMTAQSALLLIATGKAHSDTHAALVDWVMDASATAVSSGGPVTQRNRVAAQFRTSITENPSPATVVAGTTSAVSIGEQLALKVGASTGTTTEVLLPGSYGVTGSPATFVETPVLEASPGALAVTGVLATFLDPTPQWETVDTVGGATGVYSDTGRPAETAYWYRVVAVNSHGETISNTDSATTFAEATIPMEAVPGSYGLTGSAAVDVPPVREPLDVGVQVVSGVAATLVNPPLSWDAVDVVGGAVGAYSDFGLDPATGYVYRVVGTNDQGETLSNRSSAYTLSGVVVEELTAVPGLYVWTGAPAATERPALDAQPGVYVSGGSEADLELVRAIKAFEEFFTVAGLAAQMEMDLSVASGSVAVTGADATLERFVIGQQAVPVSDLVAGNWTPSSGTDLYAMVDDATDDPPVDDTYIRTVSPAEDEAVLVLAGVATPTEGDVRVLVRARKAP